MVQKILAWSTLGLAIVFIGLSLTAMFGRASLGGSFAMVAWGAVGTIAVVMLLTVVTLVLALLQ